MKRGLAIWVLALLAATGCADDRPTLVLATTTSVQDSGLLDALLPTFADSSGVRVQTIAVGTGAALRMGREGNADVLLTHAPDAEQELVDAGVLASRIPFMENFFLIAGPSDDPARIARAPSAVDALRRIRTAQAPWVSRADDSGTHRKEQALWRMAGIDPAKHWPGYMNTGSGMGFSLQVAGERRAYLLSDYATFLAFRDRVGLVALSRREPALRNVYSVMRVNSAGSPEAAQLLESFLLGEDVQERIGAFGKERFGEALFQPLHPEPADG